MGEDYRFLLNLQMVADGMEGRFLEMEIYYGEDRAILESVCFFRKGCRMAPYHAYIVKGEELADALIPDMPCALILTGDIPKGWDNGKNPIIRLPEETDLMELMNLCQDIFQFHISWADRLKNIMIREGSVEELCRASYEYFQNPLFIHDARLNVISCPVWREGMINWEKDESTGLLITPLEVLNEFKTDKEYLHTLTTRGANLFSTELRGHRDIYVNIWDEYDSYEARLVICELDSALKPGQFIAAEYLADLIRRTLSRRGRMENTYKHALEVMLVGMIQGKRFSDSEIASRIVQCGWKTDDRYVCVRLDVEEEEGNPGASPTSLCNYVEARVVGSKAISVDNRVCIIINLNMNDHYTSDISSILRDGLYKAGFSNLFHNLTELDCYYRQASVALEYCRKKNDMMWSYTFDDIAMDYIGDLCCREFRPQELCAYELTKLKEYDAANGTELYKTLVLYILNERNTVATSSELYVGRSTLFYRLRKIKEITGLDAAHMAEPVQNLYLRLSVFLTERMDDR